MSTSTQPNRTILGIRTDELLTFTPLAIMGIILAALLFWREKHPLVTTHPLDYRGAIYDSRGVPLTKVEERKQPPLTLSVPASCPATPGMTSAGRLQRLLGCHTSNLLLS